MGEAKGQATVTVKLPRRYSPAGYGLTSLKVSLGADSDLVPVVGYGVTKVCDQNQAWVYRSDSIQAPWAQEQT